MTGGTCRRSRRPADQASAQYAWAVVLGTKGEETRLNFRIRETDEYLPVIRTSHFTAQKNCAYPAPRPFAAAS